MKEPIVFEVKGYPIIKVYDDYFEIKAIDYWEFRTFNYSEIKSIEIIDSRKKWYFQLYQVLFFNARIFAKQEPILLRITKRNDGFWDYSAKNEYNSDFNSILKELKIKISN
ncbi:MAG: hypothetical protein KUL78_09210 [Flavobacterium sp.]|nr:hypothetical protein [Flavobacterium sp.]